VSGPSVSLELWLTLLMDGNAVSPGRHPLSYTLLLYSLLVDTRRDTKVLRLYHAYSGELVVSASNSFAVA
jgi:hypothetical protein